MLRSENPKKIRYPFLYECIHTPGCFHARMALLGECKFARRACSTLSSAADRLQLSGQQSDKDVGCQEVNVNMVALCLVDGHAVESAVSCRSEAWLSGLWEYCTIGMDHVVVFPHRRCTLVLPCQLRLFSNLHDIARWTRDIIRMTVMHQKTSNLISCRVCYLYRRNRGLARTSCSAL